MVRNVTTAHRAVTTLGALGVLVHLAACSWGLPESIAEWTAAHPDAGIIVNGNPDGAPPLACPPQNPPAQFATPWKPPRPHTVACNATQAKDLVDCLLLPLRKNTTDCQTKFTANATCLACIQSTSTDAQLGALVQESADITYPNLAGCVGLLQGDLSANGCAAKMHLADDCVNVACQYCADDTAFGNCANYAVSNQPCVGYQNQASCVAQYADACGFNLVSVPEQALAVTKVFCM